MGKGKFIRWLCLLGAALCILCLGGCGKKENEEAEGVPEASLSAAVQYTVPHAAALEDNILLGDTLYYLERTGDDGGEGWTEAVCRKKGEGEPEELARFQWPRQKLVHFLADRDGAVYYLYIEAEEEREGACRCGVYLRRDSASGEEEYLLLAEEGEALSVPEGKTAWDAFPESLEKWYGVTDGAADGEGRACFYSRYNVLFLFDSGGRLSCVRELGPGEGGSDAGIAGGGSEGVFWYRLGEEGASVRRIDMETGALSPEEALSFRPGEVSAILDGGEGVYVNTDKALYRFRPSAGAERLLDWGDFNLSGREVLQASAAGEGYQLLAVKNGRLRQVEVGEAAPGESGKQKVTIGVMTYGKKGLADLVEEFNAASPDYEIEMVEYDYGPVDNYDGIYLQLLKGEGPDLFELSMLGLAEDVLAEKGVLEDLAPYLEGSGTVRMEDILPSVIEAGSHGGKLVSLCPLFTIKTLAVERGHTRDGGWTPEEFLAYTAGHPGSTLYKRETGYGNVLEDLLAGDMEAYIDWEKRECSFNSERFVRLLEAVREVNISAADLEEEKGKEGLLAGKYLAAEYIVNSAEGYADAMDYLEGYGELAGYPVTSGEPWFLMRPQFSFGINGGSGCKEGAWAFLEYVMSVDFREDLGWLGWPARTDAFEDSLRFLGHVPERGVYGSRMQNFSGEILKNAPVPEITEEYKESLRFMAAHMHYDASDVWTPGYKDIILEEAWAYFAGDRTAQEAAELIQNRVGLFLSE